jgi:hypothetical protein
VSCYESRPVSGERVFPGGWHPRSIALPQRLSKIPSQQATESADFRCKMESLSSFQTLSFALGVLLSSHVPSVMKESLPI